jgi:PST family polysaccharide transporter
LLVWNIHITTTIVYAVFLMTSLGLGTASVSVLIRKVWPFRIETPAIQRMLKFAKWFVIAEIFYVGFQRIDVMLLSRYVGISEVGQYGAALRITVIASLMIGSMSSFLLPRAARSHASRPGLRSYLGEGGYLVGGLCIGVLVVWIATPIIVSTLLGDAYQPAVHLARILLLSVALLAVATPLAQLLVAGERPRHVPLSLVCKYGVLAGATLVLAARFGATGAAWAVVLSEAAGLAYAAVIVLGHWRALGSATESPSPS